MTKYKTLAFLESLGLTPVDFLRSGQYNRIRQGAGFCSEYELKFYHCKVLKMPLSSFSRSGVLGLIFHEALREYEQMLTDQEQARQERAQKAQKARAKDERLRQTAGLCGVFIVLAGLLSIGLSFYIWATF